MIRHAAIRVPGAGPSALIAEPKDCASEAEAPSRIAEVEAHRLMAHHTCLDVQTYEGPLAAALDERGIAP